MKKIPVFHALFIAGLLTLSAVSFAAEGTKYFCFKEIKDGELVERLEFSQKETCDDDETGFVYWFNETVPSQVRDNMTDAYGFVSGWLGSNMASVVLKSDIAFAGHTESGCTGSPDGFKGKYLELNEGRSISSEAGKRYTISGLCYESIDDNDGIGFVSLVHGSAGGILNVKFSDVYFSLSGDGSHAGVVSLDFEYYSNSTRDIEIEDSYFKADYAGAVFGYAKNYSGSIENVAVKNVTVDAYHHAGAVVGFAEEGSMTLNNVAVTDGKVNGQINAGGLVGFTDGSIAITKSYYQGTVSSKSRAGGILGFISGAGIVDINNTFSNGPISGGSVQGVSAAGYIIGQTSEAYDDNVTLYNNYHFGEDGVELGVGGEEFYQNGFVWSEGSDKIYANVRNAYGSLTATGPLGYYKNEEYDCSAGCGYVNGSYVDFFAGELGQPLNRHANGIASIVDMESGLLAALLNYNLESSQKNALWVSDTENDGLPVFASSSDKPNHLVVVQAQGLSNEQKANLGLVDNYTRFVTEDDLEGYHTEEMASGFSTYTTSDGSLASGVEAKIDSIKVAVGGSGAILSDNNVYEYSLPNEIDSYFVGLVVPPSSYDVVYKYCDSQNNCRDFEDVTTTALGFLTPRVDSFVDGSDAPLQLVPNVVSYNEGFGLEYVLNYELELLDENGSVVNGLASTTPAGMEFWSFQDIAQNIRIAGISDVKTIVLKYSSATYGNYPILAIANPKEFDFEVDIYGLDKNSSMVEMIESSASAEPYDLQLPYGAGVRVSSIGKYWTGYKIKDTYSVTYLYDATKNGCSAPELDSSGVENLFFGTVDALVEKMGECGTVKWTISDLDVNKAEDLVILDSVKKASFIAQKKYGNTVTEKLSIVPDYTLVNYNVSFDLNLPAGMDLSSVFLGRSWFTIDPSKMTVEGPRFPRIYTNECPTMLAWSPKENASEVTAVSNVFFDPQYYKDYINSSFLYFNPATGPDSSTTAYVYWNDVCNAIDASKILPLKYVIDFDGTVDLSDDPPVTVTLKQSFNETDIEHGMLNEEDVNKAGEYHHQVILPVADDTLIFKVSFQTRPGYSISELEFVKTDSASPAYTPNTTGETLDFKLHALNFGSDDTTLVVNTRTYSSMALNVALEYTKYRVTFIRPTVSAPTDMGGDLVDYYVPDSYLGSLWPDSKEYTIESGSDVTMPMLYAVNGCLAWSTEQTFGLNNPSVTKFDNNVIQDLSTTVYPVYYALGTKPDCADLGNLTVTAHGENLDGLELWQIIGVDDDVAGTKADTIKHSFVKDVNDETLFTLQVPRVMTFDPTTGDSEAIPFSFKIHAIPAEGYSENDKSFYQTSAGAAAQRIYLTQIVAEDSDIEFNVDLGFDYTVTFDVNSLQDTIVVLADNFSSPKTMNFGDKNRFPNAYVLSPTQYIDLYEFKPLQWSLEKDDESLVSSIFDKEFLDKSSKVYTVSENEVTLYPVEAVVTNAIEGLKMGVVAYDENGEPLMGSGYYHGGLVLTQVTDAGDTFVQKSRMYPYEPYYSHVFLYPAVDDTLTFQVSTNPDHGYDISIDGFENGWVKSELEGFGYDAATGTLKILPNLMNSLNFKISYSYKHFDLAFEYPNDTSLYVMNKIDSEYSMDWYGSMEQATLESVESPLLYNSSGCSVGWKVKGTTVDSRPENYGSNIRSVVGDLIATEDSLDFVNVMVPDLDNPVCSTGTRGTINIQKLNVEGDGEFYLVQKIGDTVLTHSFEGNSLVVPGYYESGEMPGVRLVAVAVPNEGYVLNKITYEMDNGNVLDVDDSTELNITSEGTWNVVFSEYVPEAEYIFTFDMNTEDEVFYANKFMGDEEVLRDAYDEGWIYSRGSQFRREAYTADKCLAGWSVKPDSGRAYAMFDDMLLEELEKAYPDGDKIRHATLYARWTSDLEECAGEGIRYVRVKVEQKNGSIALVERRPPMYYRGMMKTMESVVHKIGDDGTVVLPADLSMYRCPGYGVDCLDLADSAVIWTVEATPDSSYVLDSLVVLRGERSVKVVYADMGLDWDYYNWNFDNALPYILPGNLEESTLKAYFSKANKTPVMFADRRITNRGNALQLNIRASDFEPTRIVSVHLRIVNTDNGEVAVDTLLADSVASGLETSFVSFLKKSGHYKAVVTIEDDAEMDEFYQEFTVSNEIASVGKEGWQMLSLSAVDTSAIKWETGDPVFYWWDEYGTGEFWQYKQFSRGDSVIPTRGTWYSSLEGLPLVLRDDMEDDGKDIVWNLDSVSSGWNLVANPHGWPVGLYSYGADYVKDIDEKSEIEFWRYNPKTGSPEELIDGKTTLDPYEAIWVKVNKKMKWEISAEPVFWQEEEPEENHEPWQEEFPHEWEDEWYDDPNQEWLEYEKSRTLPKRVLAKATTKDRWVLQVVLSDKNGKQDAWNILGAGNNPFNAEEPPESMGDHVNLSIVEGKRALAKSIKSASDEMEWTVALSASSDRAGYLTLVGIDGVKAYGYHVYVTVDGNTTEMKDGVPLNVLLKSNAKTATVRVAPAAKVVAQNSLKGLRSARLGGKLQVSFEATGLAGTNARVDLLDMKGHVMSTVNAKTLEGTNALVLDAPKTGLYMLRVRAGSKQQAAKIVVQ